MTIFSRWVCRLGGENWLPRKLGHLTWKTRKDQEVIARDVLIWGEGGGKFSKKRLRQARWTLFAPRAVAV